LKSTDKYIPQTNNREKIGKGKKKIRKGKEERK